MIELWDTIIDLWDFILANRVQLGRLALEHLWLTGVSLFLAILIGVPTGILISKREKLSKWVLGFTSILQTIPSLALLGFMIPIFGIGAQPAVFALFLYALLPIVRNTFVGIQEVNPAVREAGIGMGMTPLQLLTRVELPLAMPTLFAGIRTAAVINVGVATLCALIAAGGLGEYIFTGISLNNSTMILAGAIPAALLAILIDGLLGRIQPYAQRLLGPILILIALAMLGSIARQIWRISQSDAVETLIVGLEPEIMEREDGWKGLKVEYGIDLEPRQMNNALLYDALVNESVDIISGNSTDGRIKAYNLKVLQDDKNYFPPYFAAPLVRAATLETHPELDSILNLLAYSIPDSTMQRLNYEVDGLKGSPREVALRFLSQRGFPTAIERKTAQPDIVIGAKIFTEQYILGELYAGLIENLTPLDVELKLGLGGTQIVFNALLAGEIDLYPEYTGTGLQVLIKPTEEVLDSLYHNPELIYPYVKEKSLEKYGGVWFDPLGFNNTYAFMMRANQADQLGIQSISDLAEYLNN